MFATCTTGMQSLNFWPWLGEQRTLALNKPETRNPKQTRKLVSGLNNPETWNPRP